MEAKQKRRVESMGNKERMAFRSRTKSFPAPEVDGGEAEADGEGHQAAADVHVLLVRHGEDDD